MGKSHPAISIIGANYLPGQEQILDYSYIIPKIY